MPTAATPTQANNINCGYINPGATEGIEQLVHTGQGILLGFLISNTSGAAVTVTFYDDTAANAGQEILAVDAPTNMEPRYVMFPRHMGLKFDDGLYVAHGNAEVAVWAVCYS